jgi:hypothetical protein
MDEAVAWVKRCPNPMPGPSEIGIRPFYEASDLAQRAAMLTGNVSARVALLADTRISANQIGGTCGKADNSTAHRSSILEADD